MAGTGWRVNLAAALLAIAPAAHAQAPLPVRDAAALGQLLDQLQVVGSVLYVAAHPDDENTAVLAALVQGRKVRACYLSMTRGGGGQNLIGSEQGDALALIRTQELLAARRLDGAEQFFTRAVDFGFSKTAEETLALWGHQAVLADVVWTIRKLRPDVLITRFSPTPGGTHGHHTASAILALEAFRAAADPARFPEQLAWVQPWQATRILWNAYRPPAQPGAPAAPVAATLDVGGYDPLLGKSYTELAAESRSLHRSQGFGALAGRGSRLETFELLAGQPCAGDPLEGVELSWNRLPGGTAVGALLRQARKAYVPDQPGRILPLLLQALQALERLPGDPRLAAKKAQLLEAIRSAAGIWVEAISDRQSAAPGETLTVATSVLARTCTGITLDGVAMAPVGPVRDQPQTLALNQPVQASFQVPVPAAAAPSQPYWLTGPRRPGLDAPADPDLAGLPEAPAPLSASFRLRAEGIPFQLTVPVRYRFRDPVLGERYQPVALLAPVLVNLAEPVQVFGDAGSRELALVAVAGRAGVAGQLQLQVPSGWKVEPPALAFTLAQAGDEQRFTVRLTPPAQAQTGELTVRVSLAGASWPAQGLVRLDYTHIPTQTLFPPAVARLVRLDLGRAGRRIGYVMGAGDELPRCLRALGYQVDLLSDETLASGELSGYDAIILGIRAFNTRPRLAQLNDRLLDYVARGGTELVQYNVDQGLVTPRIGPYPFTISRTRVCDETAPVRFLAPEHPALNWPNQITGEDFQGWVQERGLQFGQDWDARLVPVLSTGDPGEPVSGGGLLVAAHGKGQFVYTGLAFFRQLPAGVPGAYRLFANLLALGQRHD